MHSKHEDGPRCGYNESLADALKQLKQERRTVTAAVKRYKVQEETIASLHKRLGGKEVNIKRQAERIGGLKAQLTTTAGSEVAPVEPTDEAPPLDLEIIDPFAHAWARGRESANKTQRVLIEELGKALHQTRDALQGEWLVIDQLIADDESLYAKIGWVSHTTAGDLLEGGKYLDLIAKAKGDAGAGAPEKEAAAAPSPERGILLEGIQVAAHSGDISHRGWGKRAADTIGLPWPPPGPGGLPLSNLPGGE